MPPSKPEKTDSSAADSKSSTLRADYALDIKQAIRGQFVVKPQDTDFSKADSNCKNDLEYFENELLAESLPQKPSNSPRGSANRSSVGHYSLGPHR